MHIEYLQQSPIKSPDEYHTDSSEPIVFDHDRLVVITGKSNPELAEKVGNILNIQIGHPITIFEDTERRAKIGSHNLRRKDVVIVQSTARAADVVTEKGKQVPSIVNDNLMELLVMIDAAKRASAAEITAVLPYYGYARQDRKEQARVPISSALVADLLLAAGAKRIVTIDIHSDQQQGFFNGPWDNSHGSYALIPALKNHNLVNPVIISPDKGGVARATHYAKLLGTQDIAVVYKERDIKLNGRSKALFMIGDVAGRDVIVVDDIRAGGETGDNAADMLRRNGAHGVFGAVSHGLFLDGSLESLDKSPYEKFLVTDTIQHRPEVIHHPKVEIVSVAPLLAEAVRRIHTGESLSKDLFH